MNEGYSIKDMINLLLSRIWLIILITIVGGGAAFGVSKFLLPLEYSSHISMYVQSYTGISENSGNQNNISNSKQLVNTYMEVLKDDAVMNAVGDMLTEEFPPDIISQNFSVNGAGRITPSSLRSCIAISSVTDTSALKVVTTAKNAEVAAAICNDLREVAPQYVQDAVGVGSINTIDTAKVYDSPVAPNTKKNIVLGMAAGFMLTVLIIFIIDFFDNTVKDSDLMGKKYNKAIIGEIQQLSTDKKKKNKKKKGKDSGAANYIKLSDKGVPFNVVESYNSIRTNVTFSLSTSERKIFAVTSANPSDGKSTVSSNIAISLAQSGNKVLLIDADMRKSVQHKVFGLKNKRGLSSAISKMNKLGDCIQKNVMENLDVMTAGPVPPNPSELLGSENMAEILNQLSKEYSTIIIDTPPVNVVTDALELANCITGILLVMRYGMSTVDDIDTAYKKIEFVQMKLLGFIMNDVKTKRHSKYYSKYKYNKGYGYGYYGAKPENEEKNKAKGEA